MGFLLHIYIRDYLHFHANFEEKKQQSSSDFNYMKCKYTFFAPISWIMWITFILVYLGPNRSLFTSSSQQLFTPLLSNDSAGEGDKMHNISLCTFIYLRFWTVRFVYKA